MSKRALKKSKRRRSRAVVPALGITGLSLSLASGATASTGEAIGDLNAPAAAAADNPSRRSSSAPRSARHLLNGSRRSVLRPGRARTGDPFLNPDRRDPHG